MNRSYFTKPVSISVLFFLALVIAGCTAETTNSNANLVNTNANITNSFANNTNTFNSNTSVIVLEAKEPDEYQATVTLNIEARGDQQKAALPKLSAVVARSGTDRRMEFNLPNNEKVIYLDKAGTNYLILPNRKQYAELDRESLGFEVRQMMMPEQIVQRVRNVRGVEKVGEEQMNGRTVVKYRYDSLANTQTQAGQVETESFLIVDKETGLPLRTETVSEAQGNVQGYKGLSLITEMTNIKTEVDPKLFMPPTDYQKIDPQQVRAQVNLIFNAAAALISQAMQASQPAQPANTANISPSPTVQK